MVGSSPQSALNESKISSASNKYGFSNKQYNKLQIIKNSKIINFKLMVSLNRLKYNKFSLNVLKAFIELDEIIYQKDKSELSDWKSVILHINKNQSQILIGINDIAEQCESGKFDKYKLMESRKLYFGDTPTDSILLKY